MMYAVVQTVFALAATLYLGIVARLRRGLLASGGPGQAGGCTYSVVIAARNEEDAIGRCLESVLGQSIDPDRFEVIVVDDRSSDRTAAIVERYRAAHPNLSMIRIDETPAGVSPKKHAVTTAVKRAHNEIVVFTDADCVVGPRWLATLDRYFTDEVGLVQGITSYERPPGMNRLFFGLQAVDFLSHGVVAAAAIGAKVPLNSNANNLAFRRDIFEHIGGYGELSDVVSGDDDLLLQRIARTGRWRVRYMTDPPGAVNTRPTPTLRGVFEQRKRWGSKTVHYGIRQVTMLGGIFFFYLCLLAALGWGIIDRRFLRVSAAMLAVKIGGEYLLMWPGTRLFGRRELRAYLLPASVIQLPMAVLAVLMGVFGRFSWKGGRFARRAAASRSPSSP